MVLFVYLKDYILSDDQASLSWTRFYKDLSASQVK